MASSVDEDGLSGGVTGRRCCDVHCNTLGSLWYGLLVMMWHAFLLYRSVAHFLLYVALPWPDGDQPYLELNVYVGLVGGGVVLLPFFCIAFLFKIGNLANDGHKLGSNPNVPCSMDPPPLLPQAAGLLRRTWLHGGPVAATLHVVAAFCFVWPKSFIEAKLIHVGFLEQEYVWHTDLDWLVPAKERLVILQLLSSNASEASRVSSLVWSSTTPAPYHHPAAQIRSYLAEQYQWWPCSPEFINLLVSLVAFAVQYPGVFWNTNKPLSFLFSLQLLLNGVQHAVLVCGVSVLYKVQVVGAATLLFRYEPFLLNAPTTLLLYTLSSVIVGLSSTVVYMYIYQRLATFIEDQRSRCQVVADRVGRVHTSLWAYFPHCAAICVLIALLVCNAPLLYDLTIVYRGSLDSSALASVMVVVIHLFVWTLLWLVLTMKSRWQFKLRLAISRSVVREARSIKMLNEIDLETRRLRDRAGDLLVMTQGRVMAVTEPNSRKAILNVVGNRRKMVDTNHNETMDNETEKLMAGVEVKRNNDEYEPDNFKHRVEVQGVRTLPTKNRCEKLNDTNNKYNTLNMTHVEVVDNNKNNHLVLIANTSRLADHQTPPPCLLVEQHSDKALGNINGNNGNNNGNNNNGNNNNVARNAAMVKRLAPAVELIQDVSTPRSNRSIDSGLPHDDITPKSESLSTTSSSNHTTTPEQHQQRVEQHRKSSSLDDIVVVPIDSLDTTDLGQLANVAHVNTSESIYSKMAVKEGKDTLLIARKTSLTASGSLGRCSQTLTTTLTTTMTTTMTSTTTATTSAEMSDEDPYGRCLNMRLTSFQESGHPRDPRILELPHSTPSSHTASLASTPRQGSPVHYQLSSTASSAQFNTLPGGNVTSSPPIKMAATGAQGMPHNTLPARGSFGPSASSSMRSPIGRHFKPFDHRKMNPMADIQEMAKNEYVEANPYVEANAAQQHARLLHHNRAANSNNNGGNCPAQLIKSVHVPQVGSELRYTNYSTPNTSTNAKEVTPASPLTGQRQDPRICRGVSQDGD